MHDLVFHKLKKVDARLSFATVRPTNRLFKIVRTIKSPGKILGELRLTDFGKYHNLFTGVVDKHGINIIPLK